MRFRLAALALVVACGVPSAPTRGRWTTYRSDALGWSLSYPPTMDLRAVLGGAGGTLVDASTGERLVEIELWPPGLCPPDAPGATAEAIGIARAAAVTQADGPDGSSACDEPVTVREGASDHGGRWWELTLGCSDGGIKGPTFFADVSQPWRVRVLMLDPVGVDPRRAPPERAVDPAMVRAILATVSTIAVPRPQGTCIEALR